MPSTLKTAFMARLSFHSRRVKHNGSRVDARSSDLPQTIAELGT